MKIERDGERERERERESERERLLYRKRETGGKEIIYTQQTHRTARLSNSIKAAA